MVLYHLVFIGWYGFEWNVVATAGVWRVIARLSGWSFLLVAGWSAWLQLQPHHKRSQSLRWKLIKRIGLLALFASIITSITLFFATNAVIWWGILHAMTVSLAITYLLLWYRQKRALEILGWMTVFVGLFLRTMPGNWLTLPFGWPPFDFRSLDYYPLAPYAGVVWLAAVYGEALANNTAWIERKLRTSWPGKPAILWIGQHSLVIYLVHVPILWIGLWILSLI
jgi:uncharacterized membrane protein